MLYDDLLRIIGEFGRYQKLSALLVFLASIFGAASIIDLVFLLGVPGHHCVVPEVKQEILNISLSLWRNLTLPWEYRGDRWQHSQCYKFVYNESTLLGIGNGIWNSTFHNTSEVPIESCSQWSYDKSVFSSTIVTQFNLVCSRKWMVTMGLSFAMAGMMIGVFIFGNLSDRFGRRKICLIGIVGAVLFKTALLFSPNFIVFAIFKFFVMGFMMGAYAPLCVLGVELAGPSRREFIGLAGMYGWTVGYVGLAAVAYFIRQWFYLQLTFVIIMACFLLICFLIPESPRWLYVHHHTNQANAQIRRMAKINRTLHKLPHKFVIEFEEEKSENISAIIRVPILRKMTILLLYIWFTCSLVYYGLSLNSGNLGGNIYFNTMLSGAVELPANMVCQVLLHFTGRKFTMATTLLTAGVALLCTMPVPHDLTIVKITLALIGKFAVTISFSAIYMFSTELYPTTLRTVGVALGSTSARFGGVLAPFIARLGDYNRLLPMVIFGAASILAAVIVLPLPETKNKNLPESATETERFFKLNFNCCKRKPLKHSIKDGETIEESIELKSSFS